MPMTNSASEMVAVNNLEKRFGNFVAVNRISFSVEKGEIFGFLGPNGSGKSTTIRMLCGIITPTSGSGHVAGHDIVTESEQIKHAIGYMSQKFSLYEDLTVGENINFFSGIYSVGRSKKKERKEWVLEMAGLKDRENAQTKTLPGGFKQRLALGCAVLHEPPLIFLDEPTSGVDPISRRNFWNLIYEMSRAGTTVFVTTHYMDEADYCNRLALIYRGKLIAEGTPNELRQKYMVKYVLEIEVERVVEAMEALNGKGMEAAIFGNLLHAVVDTLGPSIERARSILAEANIPVYRIERILPSLEDVFVTLIEVS